MIKITSEDNGVTAEIYVPISKISNITYFAGNVYITVIGAASSIKVNESLEEIQSRIDHVMGMGKDF